MTLTSAMRSGLPALLSVALLGCGASGPSGPTAMNVHLVDGPSTDYAAINLEIQKVEIHGDGGWLVLGTPDVIVDLLSLTGGVEEMLVNGASLPAGHYDQMRLVLGSRNTVTLKDGSTPALKVPSGMQSGVKLDVSFDVSQNTTKDVFIDFDAHRSIFLHAAGNSGQYLLRPVVRAFDKVVTGAITGSLVDATTKAPLPGVMVTAQVLDATGNPDVVRTTTTRDDGTYVLDLLPVATPTAYFVVSQPIVGANVYAANASGAITISAGAPTATYDGSFGAVTAVGGISGGITPPVTDSQGDEVAVEGAVGSHTFIIQTVNASLTALGESYAVSDLPAGVYSLVVTRGTIDDSGALTLTSASSAQPATVVAGVTSTLDLTFP